MKDIFFKCSHSFDLSYLIGLAVGEIPTLKTQAKLYRNIMLYELLSDYELLHLQLKSIMRTFIWRVRTATCPFYCFCCCRCNPPDNAQSFWSCQVHALDYENENLQPGFIVRWFNRIMAWLTEEDIDSLVSNAKTWRKKNAAKNSTEPGE
jgi:hypothetical protein